jgi:hypothetical protein
VVQLLAHQRPHQQPDDDSENNYCQAKVVARNQSVDQYQQIKNGLYDQRVKHEK